LKTGTASPEAVAATGQIFHATALDHVLLNAADLEKSAAFYELIFGPAAPGNKSRVWFQAGKSRIGLMKMPDGQRAGVNRFGVTAAAFDVAAATKKLEAAGATIETPETSKSSGAIAFRDPDGFLLQVTPLIE
jgi:predicted enzyme related to lactoylglutathione lyase